MTTLYLIRHAEAEGNLYRRIHGWYDALVTPNGMRQIKALEQRFATVPIQAVYSSDLIRTQLTAGAIYLPKNLPLHLDPGLREIHMGDWEDRTWGEVRHKEPQQLALFNHSDPTFRAPHGETLGELGERVYSAVRAIAQAHPDENVALFSHGTAIRQFLGKVRGIPPQDWHSMPHHDNTAVTCLAWDGDAFHVVYEGDNSHLDDSISTLARQSWWRKGGERTPDVNLWFRPLGPDEQELYLSARRDTWITVHGTDLPFDGPGFWEAASRDLSHSPWGVSVAMAEDQFAGMIQLDLDRFHEHNAGYIPLCYMAPEFRNRGFGVQLLGHAVSFFRSQGRRALRLRCAVTNDHAQHFYAKYDFHKVGEEQGKGFLLDVLEKPITRPEIPGTIL